MSGKMGYNKAFAITAKILLFQNLRMKQKCSFFKKQIERPDGSHDFSLAFYGRFL